MARTTITDKWVVGGDGRLRDLFVVPPLLKLTLDLLYYLLIKKTKYTFIASITIISYFYNQQHLPTALITGFLAALLISLVKLAITQIKNATGHQRFRLAQHTKFKNGDPVVPLDKSETPRSAINLTRHLLIGGDSGSGKSNIVWRLLKALNDYHIPYRLRVLDPAGGVEFDALEHGTYTLSYSDRPAQADQIIQQFCDDMNERLAAMKRLGLRKFSPTAMPGEAWQYLLIDELLLCKAQILKGVLSPLGEVLSVGRKAGFIVIACTQLGQKTTLGDLRDLFPQRICFGTRTADMTDAILGTGATHEGAVCHSINQPGIGYVFTQKPDKIGGTYVRFQGPLITDTKAIANPPNTDTTPIKNPTTKSTITKPTTNPDPEGKTALYKLYAYDGTYMYAGISNNPNRRFKEHLADKEWYKDVDFAKTAIQWFPTRQLAQQAERQTIEDDRPLWNIVHGS